tara:strand:+ start:43 stop:228 length:186 start_codon:yes stop_codon:yes gene_type:complete
MSKNLWELERKMLFHKLYKEYEDEGYDNKECSSLAKKDVDCIMEDKIELVHQIWEDSYEEN